MHALISSKRVETMRKSRIATITFMLLILTIIVPIQVYASASESLIEQAEKELIETLRILDNVKQTSDVASLEPITDQLNEVLRLLEEAKRYMSDGRVTEANASAEEALALIKRTKGEAESALEASTQRTFQIQAFSWALVPVASILTALTSTKGYEWYVKREYRKLLNMTITRKKKKEKN